MAASQWVRITTWLQQNYREHLSLLNAGVKDDAIATAERRLGYRLPAELVAVLKVNDGESSQSQGLFASWLLLPLSRQVAAHEELLGDERFPRGALHPFLESGGGDYFCIDLKTGQIVEWWHEGGHNGVQAQSLAAFLEDAASKMQDGQYVVVEDFRGLVDKDEL